MNNATKAVSNGFCKTIFQQHQRVCSKNEGQEAKTGVICLSKSNCRKREKLGKNSVIGLEYGQEGSAKELGREHE